MKPSLTLVKGEGRVEIDRQDFTEWLNRQGKKRFDPGSCKPGDCFFSCYLLDNGIDHYDITFNYIYGEQRYFFPEWSVQFADKAVANVGRGGRMSAIEAMPILASIEE